MQKMTQTGIQQKLKEYKRCKKEDILHLLPIYQADELTAYLRPLTFDYKISLPQIVNVLSSWRRNNPTAGTGTFHVTDERTENWLQKFVLKNENRIIFIIMDLQGRYIGHIGFAEFDYTGKNGEGKTADIDAVLRGEKNILPGIMSDALRTLIYWGKRELKLENIFLDVFSDNLHAIQFYEKNHFEKVKRIALVKAVYDSETKWEIDENINPDLAAKCYIRMKYVGA